VTHVLAGAVLLAVLAVFGAWAMAQTWNLTVREVPGALLAWLAGGQTRRRLGGIIVRREEAAKEAARSRRMPLRLPGDPFPAELARMAGVRPVTAGLLLRAWETCPEPTRLVTPGEPACEDPACLGCRALAARRRHEAAL
jgi:hypothetical protein